MFRTFLRRFTSAERGGRLLNRLPFVSAKDGFDILAYEFRCGDCEVWALNPVDAREAWKYQGKPEMRWATLCQMLRPHSTEELVFGDSQRQELRVALRHNRDGWTRMILKRTEPQEAAFAYQEHLHWHVRHLDVRIFSPTA